MLIGVATSRAAGICGRGRGIFQQLPDQVRPAVQYARSRASSNSRARSACLLAAARGVQAGCNLLTGGMPGRGRRPACMLACTHMAWQRGMECARASHEVGVGGQRTACVLQQRQVGQQHHLRACVRSSCVAGSRSCHRRPLTWWPGERHACHNVCQAGNHLISSHSPESQWLIPSRDMDSMLRSGKLTSCLWIGLPASIRPLATAGRDCCSIRALAAV